MAKAQMMTKFLKFIFLGTPIIAVVIFIFLIVVFTPVQNNKVDLQAQPTLSAEEQAKKDAEHNAQANKNFEEAKKSVQTKPEEPKTSNVITNYKSLNTQPSFKGYTCSEDCSGHEAGYEWAEEHGITQEDVDGYSGNSDSFQEGMQSYVDENGY